VKILGLDTALGACSVAVLDDAAVLAHGHVDMVRGHAEALAPMVERAMKEARLSFAALDRLAVTTGPGTFTGQRVGLAFVRAMALALKVPALGVTTLDAMAEEALAQGGYSLAVATIDARRGEVYLGARGKNGATLLAPALMDVERAADAVVACAAECEFLLAGTGTDILMPLLRARGVNPAAGHVLQPDAIFVARLAASMTPTGEPPRPLYLRAPDAKLPVGA
jgi:tRNA threonylcarbamoyladenosine biosynthesis protein TsaB